MSDTPHPLAFLVYLKWFVIAAGLLYILTVFGLSLLAARVRQRSAWTAWIPFLNLYLMCRLANASVLLILPALIPGLNMLVFAWLGAGMAKRVGRSPVLGALFGVPVLGAVIPLVLATGPRTAEEQAAPPPARPPLVSALLNAGAVITLLVLVGVAFMAASRMSATTIPTVAQASAALPKRMTGMLTEFPIDTNTAQPARPSQVSTVSYVLPVNNETPQPDNIAKASLPPWIKPADLPALAENATSAEYTAADTAAPVSVVSLTLRESGALTPPTPEQLAEISPEATVRGVELKSAANVTYKGYRVSSPTANYYALRRDDTNTAVLISAIDAAGAAVAERLAGNIGNGDGLMEYGEYRGSFGQLPAAPPGYTLQLVRTHSEADLNALLATMEANVAGKPDVPAEARQVVALARVLMPRTYTLAGYGTADPAAGYVVAMADYSSTSNAWTAMQTLRTLKSLVPPGVGLTVSSVAVKGADAFAVDTVDSGKNYGALVLRTGSTVTVMFGEGISSQDLLPWAQGYAASK